jgi:hypothetical protein
MLKFGILKFGILKNQIINNNKIYYPKKIIFRKIKI